MKKRLVSVALVAALAAGTLAGCGSSSSGDNTQAAAGGETAGKGGSSDENITLRFAWWGGDERNEATLKVIEQFEAAHPNITIEAEYGGNPAGIRNSSRHCSGRPGSVPNLCIYR